MFTLKDFTHTFQKQLAKVITLKPPAISSQDTLMTKYDQPLNDRHSDTALLIKQINKHH